jgi:hypothetical protein
VTAILGRLRPLLIGLVVLLLTGGIAFAGKPSTPANGLQVASEASGKTVPVKAEGDEESGPAEDTASGESGGENCATDPTGLSDEELAEMRHGSVVCWAAHQETPEGYDNHGQWVSEWAKKNHGHEAGGDAVALPAGAIGHGHGHGRGHSGNH